MCYYIYVSKKTYPHETHENNTEVIIMMYSEFFERTKVEVSYEEYHYIEESYYDFPGQKDEFCKQWLKDRKSGKWELELRLRKTIDEQKKMYEKKIAEQQDSLRWYGVNYLKTVNRAERAEEKLEKLERKINKMVEIINE